MPFASEETELTIILGTALILFFAVAIVFLVALFRKKNQLYQKEKEITRSTYEQSILQTQLEIQEQTFNLISQEIHDNVGQVLSLAKVQINIMNEGDQMNREMLNEVKENIGQAMSDLRDMAKSLSSDRIRALGLYTAIGNEVERINKTGILQAGLSMEGAEKEMNEQKKLILLRIVQESLQNIIKHAKASEVQIRFRYLPDELQVSIKDNGKGFDPDEPAGRNTGLGLLNIRNRTLLAGGSSRIESAPNRGAHIQINIPYE
jgi:two-component system NarL family sensor kinase